MVRHLFGNRRRHKGNPANNCGGTIGNSRLARIEGLEDRRVLAKMADIVFIVDESLSAGAEFAWVADIVSRANGLDQYLGSLQGDIDTRYGLIGIGEGGRSYGHSQLLDPYDANGDGDRHFGSATQLASVVSSLEPDGSEEWVWDGIEHAIQEYEFRPGAAVILIAFRRDDVGQTSDFFAGNMPRDDGQQTHNGILAGMKSFNVTLNTVVEAMFDPVMGELVLGVEADRADGINDGRQVAHVVNPVANQPVAPDVLAASFNGTASGTYVDSGKSIRISKTAAAQIAGPNNGDYRAAETTYAFEEIAGTGSAITDWQLSYTTQVNAYYKELTAIELAGFTFDYYGTAYDSLSVNHDGSISFGGPPRENQNMTDWTTSRAPGGPRIAPLWEHYENFTEYSNVYWQVKDRNLSTERLVVQWDALNYTLDSGSEETETVTFEAVLYRNGDIVFNYQDTDVTDPAFTDGGSAAVGVAMDECLYPQVVPTGIFIDGVHAIEKTDFFGVDDDFVRLAWETGGAAWNNDIISGYSGNTPAYVTAFDTAFIESIGRQILDKHARGDVAFADSPVLQINMGGPALSGWMADTNPLLGANFLPTGTTVLSMTPGTIQRNGNSMAGDANTLRVFETARVMIEADLDLSIPATLVPDGRYIVELMFASFPGDSNFMRILLENGQSPVLDKYQIDHDWAKIPAGSEGAPDYEVAPEGLGDGVPIVKRYAVDVADGNGLQIHLHFLQSPALNGLRVLRAQAPRVENVIVKGSTWGEGVEYAFDELVAAGMQLRPIPTQNANTIEIHFDSPVTLNKSALRVAKTTRDEEGEEGDDSPPANSFIEISSENVQYSYDPVNYIARWTFPASGNNALVDGKYSILLDADAVTGGGQSLNGDWVNRFALEGDPTADDFSDDGQRPFLMNNGAENAQTGYFRLNFALLAGDFNGDGEVVASGPAADGITAGDRWSDATGDGLVNYSDTGVRDDNGGDFLPMRKIHGADLYDDEYIFADDLQRWKVAMAESGDGDITGDGVTDGADFMVWARLFGKYSAWWKDLSILQSAPLMGDAAPQVVDVIVSGSMSAHAAFSFDTADGSGDQLRTVPVGGADTISIVFSEEVNVSAESLLVVGMTTFNVPSVAEFSYDPLSHTATWRLAGWALGDNYLVALSETVTDVEGNWLDGEWTNPATTTTASAAISEFPSGDGAPGGMFVFAMTLLPGDANLDGWVNAADYAILAMNYGELLGMVFEGGDFNGDGAVTTADFGTLQNHFSENLQSLWLKADFDGDYDVDDADLDVIGDHAGMTGATWADGDLDGDGAVTMADLDLAFTQFGLALSVAA